MHAFRAIATYATSGSAQRLAARFATAIAASTTVLLAGCQFKQLDADYARLRQSATIRGKVTSKVATDKPLVAALFVGDAKSKGGGKLYAHEVVGKDGSYEFVVEPGRYALFAFVDQNADLKYQAGEPVVGWGATTKKRYEAFRVEPKKLYRGLDLVVPEVDPFRDARLAEGRSYEMKRGNVDTQTTWDDAALGQERGEQGLWEPLKWLDDNGGVGLYRFAPYDPNKIPVILVHGAGGYPQELKAAFQALDQDRFQAFAFSYPSGFFLDMVAEALYRAVSEVQVKYKFQRAFLVAHSMGGLVSKEFLNIYDERSRDRYIDLFVTINSPFGGNSAAAFGVQYAPTPVMSWKDMSVGSDYIQKAFSRGLPKGVEHHLFFSYAGGEPFSDEAGDGAVSVDSQLYIPAQDAAVRVYGFKDSHTGTLKNQRALGIFKRILEEAAKRPSLAERGLGVDTTESKSSGGDALHERIDTLAPQKPRSTGSKTGVKGRGKGK